MANTTTQAAVVPPHVALAKIRWQAKKPSVRFSIVIAESAARLGIPFGSARAFA